MFMDWKIQDSKDVSSPQDDIQVYAILIQNPSNWRYCSIVKKIDTYIDESSIWYGYVQLILIKLQKQFSGIIFSTNDGRRIGHPLARTHTYTHTQQQQQMNLT